MAKRTNTAKWIESRGRWQINVQKDGKRKTFTSSKPGRTGQREANAKADAWMDSDIDHTSFKVTALLDDFLDSVKLRTSYANHRNEKGICNNYIRPQIGNKKIASLTVQDLQNILDRAYKRKDKNGEIKTLSKKTLQSIRATIMSFLKYCRRRNLTTLFPEDLTIPKGARNNQKTILQPEDIRALFTIDTTILNGKRVFDEYIYAYRLEVLTGLRPGELRGLEPQNVKGRTLTITKSINIYNEITKGKNENAIRSIYLSDLAYQVLQSQLELNPDSDYIFPINSLSTYRHRWQKYCASNDIPVISLYEMRHTFVSIAKLLPEGQVKQLVGHSKDMDTFGIYGHALTGEAEETARELDGVFQKILGGTITK